MMFDHATLGWVSIMWLVLSGLIGGVGQIFLTYCYRYAEPSLLASFEYLSMIWAMVLGYFVFAEMPQTMVLRRCGRGDRIRLVHRLARTPSACRRQIAGVT